MTRWFTQYVVGGWCVGFLAALTIGAVFPVGETAGFVLGWSLSCIGMALGARLGASRL